MDRQLRRSRSSASGEVTPAWRRWVCLPLFWLACTGGGSAEPLPQLAYLRAVKPTPAPESVPVPQAPQENAARQSLTKEDFYDPGNPDLVHLQRHDDALGALPKDANGFPDWMRALRDGRIQPRTGLTPDTSSMPAFDLDVIMKNTKEMPHVRFPHRAHTLWLDCSNCHPQPFEPRAGATAITMTDIFRGKYCGMCHDRVAFVTFLSCQRCHSQPQATVPEARRP